MSTLRPASTSTSRGRSSARATGSAPRQPAGGPDRCSSRSAASTRSDRGPPPAAASVAGGALPALEHGRLPVGADRLRFLDPRAELGLGELAVDVLELDPVGVARDEVLHQHLARQFVLATLGDRKVDLDERVRVPVEDGGDAVLLEQRHVLEPVDVVSGRERQQVDVVEKRDVLLVREALAREELGVDRLDLLRLRVVDLVVMLGHLGYLPATRRCSTSVGAGRWASRSSSALSARSLRTSERISFSVTPGM